MALRFEHQQRDAWREQIVIMKGAVQHLEAGYILFEFAIPRMGKRADVVVILGGTVLIIEFKVGSSSFERKAIEQVHDYALDLKNFHRGSHALPIVPVSVARRAPAAPAQQLLWADDRVAGPALANTEQLRRVIDRIGSASGQLIDVDDWLGCARRSETSRRLKFRWSTEVRRRKRK